MRNAVMAGALLIIAAAAAAQSYNALSYELQLDAVARHAGPFARAGLMPQDNRYDDDWLTIGWDRSVLHFGIENHRHAPMEIVWNDARLRVDDQPEQRVIHGGVFIVDRRLPQSPSVIHAGRLQCDALLPTEDLHYVSKQQVVAASPFKPFSVASGRSGWYLPPLIPDLVAGDGRAAVANFAHHAIVITLPVRNGKITRRYRFRFVPTNVTAVETAIELHDQYLDSLRMMRHSVEPTDSEEDEFWFGEYAPSSDNACDPHRGADARLVAARFPSSRSSAVRAAFDHAPHRDYIVAYHAFYEGQDDVLEILDVRAKPRVVATMSLRWAYDDPVALQDVNHDGWPEITLNGHGNAASFFSIWRWTGTAIEPMAARNRQGRERHFNGEFIDVDHDGVDEIVERPSGRPFDAQQWPSYPWTIHRLRGSKYVLWRTPDYFDTLGTWLPERDFAAHNLGPARVMTIENDDYDLSPAPDATLELNGKAIARPRDFASKPRVLRFPVKLEDYNILCARGRDPVRLTITIEPAQR